MILAVAAVATIAALIAAIEWRRNRVDNQELAKLAARVDEQTAAANSRPHLPHVESRSTIHPPHNPG
jgi:hypothetical protein